MDGQIRVFISDFIFGEFDIFFLSVGSYCPTISVLGSHKPPSNTDNRDLSGAEPAMQWWIKHADWPLTSLLLAVTSVTQTLKKICTTNATKHRKIIQHMSQKYQKNYLLVTVSVSQVTVITCRHINHQDSFIHSFIFETSSWISDRTNAASHLQISPAEMKTAANRV